MGYSKAGEAVCEGRRKEVPLREMNDERKPSSLVFHRNNKGNYGPPIRVSSCTST